MTTRARNILLAEDNANDAELTVAALKVNKPVRDVVVVQDGAEALDYLFRRGAFASRSSEEPGLILLDMKMPKVDGLEVLEAVKGDPRFKTIPVVMFTSSREERDVVRTYSLGVNAYVVKPVVFGEFMEAVSVLGQFWTVVNEVPHAEYGAAPPP